jgi:hypothetical protein
MGDAKKFLSTYCIDCYTGENPSGQREFATMDLTKDNWDTQWKLQEIIDQLNLGAMPPEDAEQPTETLRLDSIHFFTQLLNEKRERSTSTSGQTVLRRLTKREYRNTVRDLLGIDMTMFDLTIEFPSDNLADHFDNRGNSLY